MKRLITLILLTLSLSAMAQHRHYPHHGHWHRGGSGNWVPVLIGGAIVGAAIANSREAVVVQPQPTFVYQQPPVYIQRQTVCTEWKEIQTTDGQTYRERTCTQ
jgi:hypothetical protein